MFRLPPNRPKRKAAEKAEKLVQSILIPNAEEEETEIEYKNDDDDAPTKPRNKKPRQSGFVSDEEKKTESEGSGEEEGSSFLENHPRFRNEFLSNLKIRLSRCETRH
jgi:hypothetical protein